MPEYKYTVKDYLDNVVARDMTIETALTLVKAFMDKYHLEDNIYYVIVRQPMNRSETDERKDWVKH